MSSSKSSGKTKTAAAKVICYTGVGAKASGSHTPAEFLRAMRATQGEGCYGGCPVDLKGWIAYSGATVRTPKRCKEIVAAASQAAKKAAKK